MSGTLFGRLRGRPDKYDQYWLGTYFPSKSQFKEATDHFAAALNGGFDHRIVYCHLLEAAMRLSGRTSPAAIRIGEIFYHMNRPFGSVESAAPPLPGCQRFENWLRNQLRLGPLGRIAKSVGLGVRGNTRN